jgi:hypothetical protein
VARGGSEVDRLGKTGKRFLMYEYGHNWRWHGARDRPAFGNGNVGV